MYRFATPGLSRRFGENVCNRIKNYRRYCWVSLDMDSPRGYRKPEDEPDIPLRKRINTFRELRYHIKRYGQEWKEGISNTLNLRELPPEHEDVYIEWAFKKNPKAFEKFLVTSDHAHKIGYSKAYLDLTKNNTMLFHGNLDTTPPKDGVVQRSGYASFAIRREKMAFNRRGLQSYFWHWRYFSHLVIRLRGDGRTYTAMLGCPGEFDFEFGDVFGYPLYTHGGPYWQYAVIPFSKFILTVNGRIPEKGQRPLVQWKKNMGPVHNISTFGVTLMDRFSGPFQLEIDWVGVFRDITNFEEWAYEMYKTPMMMP